MPTFEVPDAYVRTLYGRRYVYRPIDTWRDPLWYYSNPPDGLVAFTCNGMFSLQGAPRSTNPVLWDASRTILNDNPTWDTMSRDERYEAWLRHYDACEYSKKVGEPQLRLREAESHSLAWSCDRILYHKVGKQYRPTRVMYPAPEWTGLYTFDLYKGYTWLRRIEGPTDAELETYLALSRDDLVHYRGRTW